MKVVEPGYEILTNISADGHEELRAIERAARTCYKSEGRMYDGIGSAVALIKALINRGHEAMLEHGGMTVKFTCDRGVSHELVRHRMASFAQESTRYCNYGKNSFGHEITVIKPMWAPESDTYKLWYSTMLVCEGAYLEMIEDGIKPQAARAVLPNSLKTEIVVAAHFQASLC